MNAFTASVPPAKEHPLLSEPCNELLSLRIPKRMQGLLIEKAETGNSNLNKEVRKALAEYVEPTQSPQPIFAPATPPTKEQKALEAFGNDYVIAAIQNVAKCIENGSIECTAKGILSHFLSFCPQV